MCFVKLAQEESVRAAADAVKEQGFLQDDMCSIEEIAINPMKWTLSFNKTCNGWARDSIQAVFDYKRVRWSHLAFVGILIG